MRIAIATNILFTSVLFFYSCKPEVKQKNVPKVEITEEVFKMDKVLVPSTAYLTIRKTVPKSKQSEFYKDGYTEIVSFMSKQGVEEFLPNPIAIHYSNKVDSLIDIELGIPVQKEFESNENIVYKVMAERTALVTSHFGDFSSLGNTYVKIMKYMKDNNHKSYGAPWEMYISDSKSQPDTSKWETKIFFPIK